VSKASTISKIQGRALPSPRVRRSICGIFKAEYYANSDPVAYDAQRGHTVAESHRCTRARNRRAAANAWNCKPRVPRAQLLAALFARATNSTETAACRLAVFTLVLARRRATGVWHGILSGIRVGMRSAMQAQGIVSFSPESAYADNPLKLRRTARSASVETR